MQKRTMKNTFPDKGESYIPVCVLVLFLSALVSVLILYIGTMAQVQAQKRDVKTKLDSVVSEYAAEMFDAIKQGAPSEQYNKLSLARKAEKEENLKVQLLLRRDMKFLDDIQLQMSTAREFMFAYRITHESEDGALATLNRIEKNISDQGFEVKRADKDDIKRFLSRYFGHMTEDAIDDVDGERMIKKWIIPD